MANKPTNESVQILENMSADMTVTPHVLRRGLMGKADDGNYYNITADADGELNVCLPGKVDTNNSTSTPLLADAVFTGTATEILDFSSITLLVYANVASATNGFVVQFSPDASDWHDGEAYTIGADTTKFFTPPVQARYYRVVYTNGGSDQTTFHIHSVLKHTPIKWSSHNANDNLNDQDDGQLVIAVPKLRTAQNTYISQSATSSGNAKVSIEELESGISSNSNTQLNVTPFMADGTEGASILGYNGTNYYPVKIDSATRSLQVVSYEHHEIHSGSHFFQSGYQDLAINNVLDFTLQTPNTTKWIHFTFQIETEAETNWFIYEGATATNPLANALTPLNNNRNSATASGATLKYELQTSLANANADTDVSGATILDSGISGAGKLSGGSATRDNEIILKQNTLYCFRAIAITAGYINFDMEWYEHTHLAT